MNLQIKHSSEELKSKFLVKHPFISGLIFFTVIELLLIITRKSFVLGDSTSESILLIVLIFAVCILVGYFTAYWQRH